MLIRIRLSEIQHFSVPDKPRVLFFLLINVEMPTIVGILIFMSRKISWRRSVAYILWSNDFEVALILLDGLIS